MRTGNRHRDPRAPYVARLRLIRAYSTACRNIVARSISAGQHENTKLIRRIREERVTR